MGSIPHCNACYQLLAYRGIEFLSPFQKLFDQVLDYTRLRVFGYSNHKVQFHNPSAFLLATLMITKGISA